MAACRPYAWMTRMEEKASVAVWLALAYLRGRSAGGRGSGGGSVRGGRFRRRCPGVGARGSRQDRRPAAEPAGLGAAHFSSAPLPWPVMNWWWMMAEEMSSGRMPVTSSAMRHSYMKAIT
jgi:hypothetical protein